MNGKTGESFEVIVEAQRRGDASAYWNSKKIAVHSGWDDGSEQEKFEVLSAIRKVYNPEARANIRGSEGQTPEQVGCSEGFTRLRYLRPDMRPGATIIVKALRGYSYYPPHQPPHQ